MQSLGHGCIFCTSNPRGQTTFFASYVLSGNSLSFGSISFIITSNFSKSLVRYTILCLPLQQFQCGAQLFLVTYAIRVLQFFVIL